MNASQVHQGRPAAERTRVVLLDLDGTLVDTAPDMVGALNQLRREAGHDSLPLEEVRPLVSHGARGLVQMGFPQASGAEFEAPRGRFLDIYRSRLARETKLYDGLGEALTRLESAGIVWGIVTNKPGWLTQPLLEHLALHQRAGAVNSAANYKTRKASTCRRSHAAKSLEAVSGDTL
jgi:phosphoglycolate phosphatase